MVGAGPVPAWLGILARNQPAAAQTKAISWGPPPCSSIRKEGSPLGMEEQGDLRSGEDVTEESAGFPHVRPVTSTRAPGLQAPERRRAAYLGLQVSCGVMERGGHSPGETVHRGIQRLHGKARGLAAPLPGPRFTAGECLLRTPRTGGLRFLHGEWGSSSGGMRSKLSHSLLGWFSTDFTE